MSAHAFHLGRPDDARMLGAVMATGLQWRCSLYFDMSGSRCCSSMMQSGGSA